MWVDPQFNDGLNTQSRIISNSKREIGLNLNLNVCHCILLYVKRHVAASSLHKCRS